MDISQNNLNILIDKLPISEERKRTLREKAASDEAGAKEEIRIMLQAAAENLAVDRELAAAETELQKDLDSIELDAEALATGLLADKTAADIERLRNELHS